MIRSKAVLLVLWAVVLVVMVGCGDDNPVADEHATHLEAFGVRVYDGDSLLAEADGVDVTGSFGVAVGDTTAWLTLEFLDDEGAWYDPESRVHLEEGETSPFALSVEESGSNVAVVMGTHDDGTEWQFRLAGVAVGDDAIRVKTLHEGHDDYVSPEMTVTVVASP